VGGREGEREGRRVVSEGGRKGEGPVAQVVPLPN
jgi:hypothetical protein